MAYYLPHDSKSCLRAALNIAMSFHAKINVTVRVMKVISMREER